MPVELERQLRDEGNYARRSLPTVDYDFAGYRKSERIDTRFGEFPTWDYPYEPKTGRFELQPRFRLDQPYFTRTGGVKRGSSFSADSIGRIYRNNLILWHDGLGNTLYESLKISGKYGLNHYFYAPDYDPYRELPQGPVLPFTDEEIEEYAEAFPEELERMRRFIDEVEPLYYREWIDEPEQLWLLFTGIDTSPLGLFLLAIDRNYEGVNEEFRSRYGFDLPLDPEHDPNDPQDVVKRIKLWDYIREQHGKVGHVRSEQFRERISGRGKLASNIHMATQVDYEWYGRSFDHPGVAIRPMLIGHELVWKHYMGYGTRLTNDLTDRIPLVSPRINLASSGARIVPTRAAIKYWFSQVVQNGAVGFYDWLKDYPADEKDPTSFGGVVWAHPDPSARGPERWETALELARTLGQAHVFTPPPSEVGILVNIEDASVEKGWFNVFSAYVELTEAEVWSTFVSSTELRNESESLGRYRVLVVPKAEYLYRSVAEDIESFARGGGTVLITDPDAFSYDLEGEPLTRFRRSFLGVRGVEPYTGAERRVSFSGIFAGASISPYIQPYTITGGTRGLRVLATYPDGRPAVVSHRVGTGQVIFAPGLLFDVYAWDGYAADRVDTGRYAFLKALEKEHGIEDRSWVWDVTVDNVHEITGSYEHDLPPIDEDIQFRWYMNPFLP